MDRSSKEVSTPERFIEALKACKFVFLNIYKLQGAADASLTINNELSKENLDQTEDSN